MKNKKKILTVLVAVLVVATIAVVCVALYVKPTVDHALRISDLLQPLMGAKNQTMHFAISAQVDGKPLELESDVHLVTEDGCSYLVVEKNDSAIYILDNVLFLENGKAFKIGDKVQKQAVSYRDLIPHIGTLYQAMKITAAETTDETAYSITVAGEQVHSLLAAAAFGEALPVAGIEQLELQLTERNEKLAQITFSGNGNLDGTDLSLQVTISGFRILASGDYLIPAEVKRSAATVDPDTLFSLSEDLYRLIIALTSIPDKQSQNGTLKLAVDCGLIQLDTQLRLSDLKTGANGQLDSEKLQELPEILGFLCMEGNISCVPKGMAYIYALKLDEQAMQELSGIILPELRQYGGNLTEGSVTIVLENNEITSMKLSIDGKINILIAQVPITVSAEYCFD